VVHFRASAEVCLSYRTTGKLMTTSCSPSGSGNRQCCQFFFAICKEQALSLISVLRTNTSFRSAISSFLMWTGCSICYTSWNLTLSSHTSMIRRLSGIDVADRCRYTDANVIPRSSWLISNRCHYWPLFSVTEASSIFSPPSLPSGHQNLYLRTKVIYF
jgi:hypothetical protein